MPKHIVLLLLIVAFCCSATAQEKTPVKFGKVSTEDFQTIVYPIDTSASAVVIANVGYSYFEGNQDGWFTFFHKHQMRAHILKKSGYDAATVEIYLYYDGKTEEKVQSLKAYTYNLENGKVVETKLDNKSVFTEKINKNTIVKKFTLPNIKEGSIIEYSYTVESEFLRHPTTWYFQGEHPVLWSELEFAIPEFFNYVFITEGYNAYYKKQQANSSQGAFDITIESMEAGSTMKRERVRIPALVYNHRWVMKDLPALKLESYTSSLKNHISKIEFQLSEMREPLKYRTIMQSWQMLTRELLESEHFGLHLAKGNGWMDEDLMPLTTGAHNETEKAKRIYEFVRDKFTCTSQSGVFMTQVLKNVMKQRKGNVAEINLLLVSMLKNAGLKAEPVLLSTRKHGYTYSMYPLMDKFNYVIAVVEVDGKRLFLDATKPKMAFGKLLPDCYNGHARMVNTEATPLEFVSDSLAEKKLTSIFISKDDKGRIAGSFQQTPGIFGSYSIRHSVNEKGVDEFFQGLKKTSNIEIEMSEKVIDSLNKLDEPLQVRYEFVLPKEEEEIIYFNPMITEGLKENPFKSAVRLYPVEMPYTTDETYVLRMEIPEGYGVEELPKSVRANFDENGDSYFEYLISESGGIISLRSRIKLNRTYFTPEEYEVLREFLGFIVKKHGEQIVFKKKK